MARLDRYTDQERKEILDAMEMVKLETVEPIIFWGTLLGAVREKGFIAHDDDIDFAYISKYHTIEEVQKELYEVYKELDDKGWLKKIFAIGEIVCELPPKERFKGRGQCHFAVGKGYFDLFTLWFDENGELQSYPLINLGRSYLPLMEYELYDRKFKSISNAESFLARVYGAWRIPSKEKSKKKHYVLLK